MNRMSQNESPGVSIFITLHLKARDHTKFNSKFSCYDLWMSFKSFHNFMVAALGHSVKWPQVLNKYRKLKFK
jgi:hypothetical protein